MNNFTDPYDAEDVIINRKSSLPLVWFLPLIAFIVSGWLIYKAVSEKGPVVTISFPNADGLEVDRAADRTAGTGLERGAGPGSGSFHGGAGGKQAARGGETGDANGIA